MIKLGLQTRHPTMSCKCYFLFKDMGFILKISKRQGSGDKGWV